MDGHEKQSIFGSRLFGVFTSPRLACGAAAAATGQQFYGLGGHCSILSTDTLMFAVECVYDVCRGRLFCPFKPHNH